MHVTHPLHSFWYFPLKALCPMLGVCAKLEQLQISIVLTILYL